MQEAVAPHQLAEVFVTLRFHSEGVFCQADKRLCRLGEQTPAQRAAYSGTRAMSQERTAPASGAGPAASIQPWTATKSSD